MEGLLQAAGPDTGNPSTGTGEGAQASSGSFATDLLNPQAGSSQGAPAPAAKGQDTPAKETALGSPKPTEALPGWTNATTKELRSDPRFNAFASKFKTFDEAVKSAIEIESKIGKMVAIPDDKSTPEEKAEFFKRFGVPSKPEQYKLEKSKDYEYDEAQVGEFAKLAHSMNLSQEQANAMFKAVNERGAQAIIEHQARSEAAKAEVESSLKKEWGGDYDQNVEVMRRGLRFYGDKDLLADAARTGMGNSAAFVRLFHKLGLTVREDSAVSRSGVKVSDKSTADIFYGPK